MPFQTITQPKEQNFIFLKKKFQRFVKMLEERFCRQKRKKGILCCWFCVGKFANIKKSLNYVGTKRTQYNDSILCFHKFQELMNS